MDTKALFHRPFALHLSVQAPNKAAAVGFSILGNQKSSNDDAHTPPVSSWYRFSIILLMMIVYHSDAIFKPSPKNRLQYCMKEQKANGNLL